MRRVAIPENQTTKAVVTVLCTYEVVAIHTRLPTITAISARHPWVGAVIVGALTVHFLPD